MRVLCARLYHGEIRIRLCIHQKVLGFGSFMQSCAYGLLEYWQPDVHSEGMSSALF